LKTGYRRIIEIDNVIFKKTLFLIMLSKTEKIVLKEAYRSDKAMETLITLCDDYGGRFAGTEENQMAAEYILSLYEDYNFNNPHLEHFSFPGCKVGESSLIIKGTNRAIETLSLPMAPLKAKLYRLKPSKT
jgi:hypothetical protein